MDNARRDWLLSFDEKAAESLPRQDWYDRTRLLRQKEASQMLERINKGVTYTPVEKVQPRASNDPKKAYTYWQEKEA